MVGSCVHVATVICYLSYLRYTSFKVPAVNNQFLWIGSNIISNYHILHYKGPLKKVKVFKKEVNNILQIAKK